MQEIVSTLTTKGQVTIPIEVRRQLGLTAGDKVAFIVDDGHVCLAPRKSVVARTAGIFKGTEPPLTAEELREAAEQAIADDVMERAQRR